MSKEFYDEITEFIIKEKPSKDKLTKYKNKLCAKYKLKFIPTDIQILLNAEEKHIKEIKPYLITKPVRTISGVSVIAIMSKPMRCPHGKCLFCPGGLESEFGDVPQSYTGKEPATRRGIRNKFSAYLQVMNRLEQYVVSGHIPDKVELIIMGGTFISYPKVYRDRFTKEAFQAMNDFSDLFFNKGNLNIKKFKQFFELPGDIYDEKRTRLIHKKLMKLKQETTLEKEQKKNESSMIRCVGFTIETRPDYGKLSHGNEMLRLGATRVELGIEALDNSLLKRSERGHTLEDSIESIKTLRDLGFKLNFHMMPGLPGSTPAKDLKQLKELFTNSDYQPDMLKIYPCMVLKGTKLYNLYKKGKYKPLSTKEATKLIAAFKPSIPEYVRVMRVQRDIPSFTIEAGVDKTNLRQYIHKEMKENKTKCRCIRCREITDKPITKPEIVIREYDANEGKEFFISVEDKKADNIIGFIRLRLPSQTLRKEITKDSALVRELHVYGSATQIGKKGNTQHKGFGKLLLKEAEKIAKKHDRSKMIIISGIGVRDYYRKQGYKKQGVYMVNNL